MRKRSWGVVLVLAMAMGYSPAMFAQAKPSPEKAASEKAAAAKPFDPHDLSGVWIEDHPRLMASGGAILGLQVHDRGAAND